jgi:hypothetical protein
VGGHGHDGSTPLSSVERYDEATDQWELVVSMSTTRFDLGVSATPPTWVCTSSSSVLSEVLSLDNDY